MYKLSYCDLLPSSFPYVSSPLILEYTSQIRKSRPVILQSHKNISMLSLFKNVRYSFINLDQIQSLDPL